MAVANPDIFTTVKVNSDLSGYSLYSSSSITGTFTNEGTSCEINTLTYFKIKNANGVDVTNLFYAEGTSTEASYDTMKYNNGSFTYEVMAAGSTPTTVTFKQYEKNIQTLGNIPMGELTFNGVQSVTYNGTDYTKLVVDGTSYPPPVTIISFTIAGTSYQAEEGMTWEEWITSKYNTSGFKIIGSVVLNSSGSEYVVDKDQTVGTAVNNHSIIIANKSYVYGSGTPEKK